MPPGFYYNEGTGRSYIDATRIDCSQLNAANVSAKTVSSSNLSGGAQNGLGPQVVDYLATTTSSNSYAIINKPALAQVALTGSYLSLVGTPNLSNVAVTGSYRDLANVPSFANVAFTNSYNSLSNLPALSQVAYTGSYANLTGRPANLTSFNNDLTTFPNNLTTAGNVTVTKALAAGTVSANLITLPNASFTGQYSELKGLPVANSIAANTLSLTANVDYPVNITENYTAGANGYSHPLSALNPTQSTGEAFVMQVGQTASTYAASYFGHVNQGAANSYATIGLYGQDRILNVTANKQVGINTTNPQYNLDVVGNAQVSSLITAGGGLYTNKAVQIAYNANSVGLLCYGPATMGYTQFGTPTGMTCPTVSYQGPGPSFGATNPANTVTTTLNFVPNGYQAAYTAAALQVRDDGQPYLVNGSYVQPSAYLSFQTGGTERLLIGNSGVVSVPGTFVTPTLKQTNAYSSRYTLSANQALAAGSEALLTGWGSPTTFNTQGAPVTFSNGNFTTTVAGVWSLQVRIRYNATASENATTIYSAGGTAFASGSRLATNDTSVYDLCVPFTGYLASGDSFQVQSYSSIANSVVAQSGNIYSFFHLTLLQRCS